MLAKEKEINGVPYSISQERRKRNLGILVYLTLREKKILPSIFPLER